YLDGEMHLPERYITSVQAVCDAFKNMPRCIFDVLRARSILTPAAPVTFAAAATRCSAPPSPNWGSMPTVLSLNMSKHPSKTATAFPMVSTIIPQPLSSL
ncbi:MAG: hypothetical protein PHP02_08645, partial [Eubacteriales bacterium]|nr:hypothetical protein [Eubacteriales bacterium]